MNMIYNIFDYWIVKLLLGSLLMLLSPFKSSLIILLTLLIMDTACGVFYAARMKALSSIGFRKGVTKIALYFASILTIRMAEIGISQIIETTFPTQLIIGYFIITEAISILENLTLLGVPLPSRITSIIAGTIKNETLKFLVLDGLNKNKYKNELANLINYQIPGFKSKVIKKLIKTISEEWIPAVNILEIELSKAEMENNDLLFYRVTSILKITNTIIYEKWSKTTPSKKCAESLSKLYIPAFSEYTDSINKICYMNEPLEKKKKEIIECIIVSLYKTIEYIQKKEIDLLKGKCDRPQNE